MAGILKIDTYRAKHHKNAAVPSVTSLSTGQVWSVRGALILLIIIIGCSSSGSTDGGESAVDITLTVEGMGAKDGFLGGIKGESYFTVDSFSLDDKGIMRITRTEPLAQGLYYIVVPDLPVNVQMLLTEDQAFELTTTASDVIGDMQVSGSPENELLYRNLKFEQGYQKEFDEVRNRLMAAQEGSDAFNSIKAEQEALIDKRIAHIEEFREEHPDAFFTTFKLAGQNPRVQEPRLPNGEIDEQMQVYLYRRDFWEDVDFSDGRLLHTPVYHTKLKRYIEHLVPQRRDSLIKYADYLTRKSMANDSLFKYTANYIGIKYKEPEFMGGDAVYVHMVKNFFIEDLAFWSNEYEIRHLQQDADIRDKSMLDRIGQNITITAMDGSKFSLYDMKAPIKVLYIYTTECDNCRKETPKVLEVYQQWKSRGVDVLALCTDEDEAAWKSYVQSNNLTWHNGFDANNESRYKFKWHIDITPEIYVMDKDFKIIGKDLKAFQMAEVIERELAKG